MLCSSQGNALALCEHSSCSAWLCDEDEAVDELIVNGYGCTCGCS